MSGNRQGSWWDDRYYEPNRTGNLRTNLFTGGPTASGVCCCRGSLMMNARILIADDDEVSCQLFAELLEKEGYQVDQAQSGAEALSLLREQRHDLLIIDVRMPGITGLEVSRAAHMEYPALPVIVMTAFGSMETAIEAIHEGAFDFISKPMNVEELKKTVARALQQRVLQGKARANGEDNEGSDMLGTI